MQCSQRNCLSTVVLVFVWSSSWRAALGSAVLYTGESSLSCGEACCYLLLQRMQRDVAFDRIRESLRECPTEASFADLKRALAEVDLDVKGMRLTLDQLKALGVPCIVQVVEGPSEQIRHYQVVQGLGDQLLVMDPLQNSPMLLSQSQQEHYRHYYRGNALIPASTIPWRYVLITPQNIWILGGAMCTGMLVVLVRRRARNVLSGHGPTSSAAASEPGGGS